MFIKKEFRSIKLKWKSLPVSRKFPEFIEAVAKQWPNEEDSDGIYVFEGKHDGHREGTILYIGMTKKLGGERVTRSAQDFFFKRDEPRDMYGSYWDLTMRWVALDTDDEKLTKALESILIVSNWPVLNSREKRDWLNDDARDLVVSNCLDKGLLLPMLHGDYFEISPSNI